MKVAKPAKDTLSTSGAVATATATEATAASSQKGNELQESLRKLKRSFFVKDFEDLFRVVSYFIIGLFLFFINGLMQFRDYAQQNSIQTIPWEWNCLSICVVFSLFGLKYLIKTTCWDWAMENISETYTGEVRVIRAKKILKWIYDTVYYSTTTVFSLLAFRQSTFMPSVFGGSGECSGILSSYPQFPSGPDTNFVLLYHLVQFGSHAFSFIELVFLRRKEEQKFYEYTLHHFMAAGLIFYSGMFNFIYVSVLVLVIHDMGDIIVAGGRAYADMKFKSKYVLYTIMAIALLVWIGTRIVIFPSCIIYTCWQNFANPIWGVWDMIKYAYYYQFIQLIILFFMHCYWTLFMLKIVFSYAVKPNYSNVYDNKDFKKQFIKKSD